jgi:hypothetical protein
VTRRHPEWLHQHELTLLRLARTTRDIELHWHLAQMLPRITLLAGERRAAVTLLFAYLEDRSRIVATSALPALADFAADDTVLRRRLAPVIDSAVRHDIPAIRARARKLAKRLVDKDGGR